MGLISVYRYRHRYYLALECGHWSPVTREIDLRHVVLYGAFCPRCKGKEPTKVLHYFEFGGKRERRTAV